MNTKFLAMSLLIFVNSTVFAAKNIKKERIMQFPAQIKEIKFGIGKVTFSSGNKKIEINVEIADTPEKSERGLMYRNRLGEKNGMIFIFDKPSISAFWMKNTLIPLSIAFFDQKGKIIDILDMEPCTKDPCDIYTPRQSYVGAIEVNKGFFAKNGIKIGWQIKLI